MNNQQLIEMLNNCVASCNYCTASCLNEDDVKMMVECIRLDMDCAEICRTTANLLARGSEHGSHLLQECAEICSKCASECEKHAPQMAHCKACAEACRKCEDACKKALNN